MIYNVYVVDNDYRLLGTFPLKKMLTHPSVSKIKHVMESDISSAGMSAMSLRRSSSSSSMSTSAAVSSSSRPDEDGRDEILSHIDDVEQAGDIIDLLKYDEDTAGGLMGTEMIVVNERSSSSSSMSTSAAVSSSSRR